MANCSQGIQFILFGEFLEKVRVLNLVLKLCESRHGQEHFEHSRQLIIKKQQISISMGIHVSETAIYSFKGFTVQPLSAQSVTIVNENELHLRLQITSPMTSAPSHTYGILDLQEKLLTDTQEYRILNIQCKKCQTAVTHINRTFSRVLDLPSENWQEYLDNWCCHGNDAISKLKCSLNPKSHDCFLGNWYVVVHSEAVDAKNVEITKDDDMHLVKCKRCRAVLGELSSPSDELVHTECDDARDYGQSVKLYKYSVSMIANIDCTPTDIFRDFGEEIYLARKFLTLIKSRLCHKFIINGTRERRGVKAPCFALLWILNTDAKFLTCRYSNEGCQEEIERKDKFCALKVFYKNYFHHNFASVKEEWYSSAQTDIVTFPDEICLKLLLILKRNSEQEPPSTRRENGLHVSFLKMQTS